MSNFSIYLSSILKSEVFSIILELPIKSRDFVFLLLDPLLPLLLNSSSTHLPLLLNSSSKRRGGKDEERMIIGQLLRSKQE